MTNLTLSENRRKFEIGSTYKTRSICDHNCIIEHTITNRTATTVTDSTGKRFRVSEYNGVEFFRPWGNYSMAPILRAEKHA